MTRLLLAIAAEIALCALWNTCDDWTQERLPVKFVLCALFAGVAFFIAASAFRGVGDSRRNAFVFWMIAVLLRLVVLPLEPGDDLWRYQWEGKIQRAGFNPYVLAPDAVELMPARESYPGWSKINHRDFAAIYPPGTELIFRELSAISDSPLLYKILFAAADLGTAALLLRLVGGVHRFSRVACYAWNPLVVYSFAGAAHFDSLMILPMMAGVLLLVRQNAAATTSARWSLAIFAALAFGVAISIKFIPALLLLLCAVSLGQYAVTLILSIAMPAALSLIYGFPGVSIFDSLRRFAYVTRLNDLFWWLIEETVWPNPRQKNYSYNVVIIAAVVLLSVAFMRNWKRGMLWVMGSILILSPVLHPWYCTWILPFAVWRRAHTWQVLSVTVFAYFLFWNERLFALPWHTEPWQRAMVIGPPLIMLALPVWRRLSSNHSLPED